VTTSSPNNDFFPDVDELFGNINMGDNTDDATASTNVVAAMATARPYGVSIFPVLDLARVSSSAVCSRCDRFILFRCYLFIYSIDLHV
jgi:hypothetical protein